MAERDPLQENLERFRRGFDEWLRRREQAEAYWRQRGVPAPERMGYLQMSDPILAGLLRGLYTVGQAYEATGIPAFVQRLGESAGQTAFMSPLPERATTGSPVADTAADIAGQIAGQLAQLAAAEMAAGGAVGLLGRIPALARVAGSVPALARTVGRGLATGAALTGLQAALAPPEQRPGARELAANAAFMAGANLGGALAREAIARLAPGLGYAQVFGRALFPWEAPIAGAAAGLAGTAAAYPFQPTGNLPEEAARNAATMAIMDTLFGMIRPYPPQAEMLGSFQKIADALGRGRQAAANRSPWQRRAAEVDFWSAVNEAYHNARRINATLPNRMPEEVRQRLRSLWEQATAQPEPRNVTPQAERPPEAAQAAAVPPTQPPTVAPGAQAIAPPEPAAPSPSPEAAAPAARAPQVSPPATPAEPPAAKAPEPPSVTPRVGGRYTARVLKTGQEFTGTVERVFRARTGAVLAVLRTDDGTTKTIPVSKYAHWRPAGEPSGIGQAVVQLTQQQEAQAAAPTETAPAPVPSAGQAPKPYEGLRPGTPEWMQVWREHPELQAEMLDYARAHGEQAAPQGQAAPAQQESASASPDTLQAPSASEATPAPEQPRPPWPDNIDRYTPTPKPSGSLDVLRGRLQVAEYDGDLWATDADRSILVRLTPRQRESKRVKEAEPLPVSPDRLLALSRSEGMVDLPEPQWQGSAPGMDLVAWRVGDRFIYVQRPFYDFARAAGLRLAVTSGASPVVFGYDRSGRVALAVAPVFPPPSARETRPAAPAAQAPPAVEGAAHEGTPPAAAPVPEPARAPASAQEPTPAPAPAAPEPEPEAPQVPTLEWGPGKAGYIRTLPSYAEQSRFHSQAKEVGWIDQPYGHKLPVYWYRGQLVRIQSAAGAGMGDRRAYLHQVNPDELGSAFHWRDNEAARNARRHWEAQQKARQQQAQQTAEAAPSPVGGVEIRENPERNSIEIRFPSKPAPDILQVLHQAGFRWSPRQGLWYARRTDRTVAAAEEIRRRMGAAEPASEDSGEEGGDEGEPVLGMPEVAVTKPEAPAVETPAPVRTAPPVSEAAIVSQLADRFQVPIRVGRLTLRKARGEYKVKPEVIRVKAANDLRAMAHEIGHHLAHTMGLKPEKYQDLESLGQALYPDAGPAKWRREGLAEFVALYFANPEEARQKAPTFARDFEEALKANPTIAAAVTEAQAMWQAYFGATPEARIKAHIVHEMPKPKPWLTPMEVFYALWVDDLYPVYKAVRDLRGGEPTDRVLRDAYALARLARGRFRRAEAWLVGKPMDLQGNPVGPSLKEILEPVRDRIEDFEEYLVVRRAKELMERRNEKGEPAPIETGMRPEDVQAEFERLHADPVLRKAAEQLDAYQDALLRVLVQSGRVSQDLAEKVRQLNRYYVPFQRVFYDSDRGPGGGGRMRWADLPDPIRRIRGSARPIFSPLASVIRNTIVFHDLAARNLVGAALAAEAEKAEGMGWLMEKVPRPVQPVSVNLERLRDALEEAGIPASDLEDADLERVAVLFYPVERARGKEQRENIAVIYRNGKPEFWQMHPDLYRAMEAMDNPPAHWIIRILSLPTRVLRAGATLNPEFALRNPIRDTYESWLYRKLGYRPIDTLRGLMHVIKRDDLYWDWVNSGGAQSTFVSVERDYLNRDLNRLIGRETMADKAVRIIRWPIDILEAFSQATEEATRVGAYLRALETQGQRTAESRARAGLWSRDVSIDFNRAGLHGRQYNAIHAFFNVRMQDLDRLGRAFRANPWGMTLRALLYVTLPSVALYLINRNDPAYEELPRWRKDLFWCLRVGGRWLFIPKPGTIGVLFGSVPERFLEYVDKQDPKALDDLGKTLADSALPGDPTSAFDWLPDAFLPWVEASAGPGGWDSFQERPIVPLAEQRLEPWAQYGPQTSELAKAIGRAFNVSPRKVDHVIYGYAGGLGRHALNLLDILAGHALEKRTLSELTPGLGGFTQRAYVTSDSLDRFYQELDALEREYETLREQLQRQGSNPNLARALMQNYQRLQQMRRVADRIAQLRNQQRQWLERPGVPADVKRRYADDYQRQMINLARQAIGRGPLPEGE